jgi:hypothetical protein
MTDFGMEFARTCKLMSYEEVNSLAIRFVEGKEEPELYLRDLLGFYPLTINFEEYIELLLDNMGMEYWQRYFIDPSSNPDKHFKTLPPTVKFIQEVFPAVDISKYRKVYS